MIVNRCIANIKMQKKIKQTSGIPRMNLVFKRLNRPITRKNYLQLFWLLVKKIENHFFLSLITSENNFLGKFI